MLLAKIPEFLSDDVSEIVSDGNLGAAKEGSILKIEIPKIEPGNCVEVSYSIPKWITQDKADLIPLPAVVSYSEGQALKVELKSGKGSPARKKSESLSAVAEERKSVGAQKEKP